MICKTYGEPSGKPSSITKILESTDEGVDELSYMWQAITSDHQPQTICNFDFKFLLTGLVLYIK